MAVCVPFIDERVSVVGISKFRRMNATNLRAQMGLLVIGDNAGPIAVLVPYEMFLRMQADLVDYDVAQSSPEGDRRP